MAELAAGALGVVTAVVISVAKPIKRQFNYLCRFTSNIDSLKDEADKLEDAITGLKREVLIARDNLQEPVPEVESWLTYSKKIQDEINGTFYEASNVESGCLKLGARFSLSRRAKKTTDRTKELRGQKPEAVLVPRPKAATQQVELGKTFECESRNKIEEDIMTTLRGGEVNLIGICGMAGVGKTTMAKKIMNKVLNEKVFQEVVMTVVSQQAETSKIQVEIGRSLGLHLNDDTSETRVQKLHARLSDTKRPTLLVLDDFWKTLSLEEFGIPGDSKWCTILFTSRNRDVLHQMGVQIFGMKVLSEEEAWFFFRERVGTCVDDRKLNPIAKQVAKECGGLPINLAAIGAVLKDKRNAAIWKATLRKLKQNVPDNVEHEKETYNPLKLSYDCLESKQAQSIFLLCCMFPEDAHIPLENLTYFCMGLGIFDEDITNTEAAKNMRTLTDLLKDRTLLVESDKEDCVRMPHGVRDFGTSIAKEKGYIGEESCTWISSSHLLSGSRYPNLRLLFLNSKFDSSGFKFDDAFVKEMRELQVLCIERYAFTTLPHPTQSLKTLILDSCEALETISIVGELVNLKILICRGCERIEKLPQEMKRLKCLKLLELTGCKKLQSIGRGIIKSLVGLEELKMLDSFNGWEERENASIYELEDLPNLECLEIDILDGSLVAKNIPLFLRKKIVRFTIRTDFRDIPSKFSRAMSLCLERESRLGEWIEKQFRRDTECLYLSGDGASNVDLAKSLNIKWLELAYCKSMKNVVRTSDGDDATVFPSIEYLKLLYLHELQEICDGPISSTSFQNLKELRLRGLSRLTQFWKDSNYVPHFSNLSSIDIEECHGLLNLGQLSMAGKDCFPQLQQLRISNCEMMQQVFLWNNEEAGEIETSIESQQKQTFRKLKEVKLLSLPNLTTFYQGIQAIEFPLLREIVIYMCPNMESFSMGVLSPYQSFNLKIVEIEDEQTGVPKF